MEPGHHPAKQQQQQLPVDSSFDLFMRVDIFANALAHYRLPNPPFDRLPLCECSQSFLQWTQRMFPNVLGSTSQQDLEAALQAITKEYAFRKPPGGTSRHNLNFCLSDLYKQLVLDIRERQEELRRHPPRTSGHDPTLYIGHDVADGQE